ncbi:MAG: phytanoyl-CoA dioxygenase family protein [Ignavibacteriaceae bacterium]
MLTTDSVNEISETDTGILGVYHLKRFWWCVLSKINNYQPASAKALYESHLDYLVINALGLNFEQTVRFLNQTTPRFEEFEQWIIDITCGVDDIQVALINAAISGTDYPEDIKKHITYIENHEPVLSKEDIEFWNKQGYVVLHNAVSLQNCCLAVEAIFNHLDANLEHPDSWYKNWDRGIMLQFYQHLALKANRESSTIHKAFSQLWGTADLWASTDNCAFNIPERHGWLFSGPDLHWDICLKSPIPFGTRAILYLTDTTPEQGAFTCIPGFHHQIDEWISSLPAGADPCKQILHNPGSKTIEGKAGDLIIWHHALPYGFTPNRGLKPMIAQYINFYPAIINK